MLYSRFSSEADFRNRFVRPLLNRLGFFGVAEQHGSQEFGKDFVFSELHRLGGVRHYAAQVKHEERIGQGIAVDQLLSQVRQAFGTPFRRADSPRPCHVSAVYIFNSGTITANAKEQFLSDLGLERYGDNVHFLDSERLETLDQHSTLQTDQTARSRLLGLRGCLRRIISDLTENHLHGQETLAPVYIHGIELYVSEPVDPDDDLLRTLFELWQSLQQLETVRRIYPLGSTNAQVLAPRIVQIAAIALPKATAACELVDISIQRLTPPLTT